MSQDQKTEAIQSEIASLEEYCEELLEAIGELEHESRRYRDKLERAGEQSHSLARELKRLEENRDHNRKELEKARRRLKTLRARLGD